MVKCFTSAGADGGGSLVLWLQHWAEAHLLHLPVLENTSTEFCPFPHAEEGFGPSSCACMEQAFLCLDKNPPDCITWTGKVPGLGVQMLGAAQESRSSESCIPAQGWRKQSLDRHKEITRVKTGPRVNKGLKTKQT